MFAGIEVTTGRAVAIKKYAASSRSLAIREVKIHSKVSQLPYVLELYNCFEDVRNEVYLVCELGTEGDLFDRIIKCAGSSGRGTLTKAYESETIQLFKQLLKAMNACHARGIAHRDIKPENVLLKKDERGRLSVRLADFGCSTRIAKKMPRRIAGTPQYMPPEIWSMHSGYDLKLADRWSLGVTLYTMLTARLPFDSDSHTELRSLITTTDPLLQKEALGLSPSAYTILRILLSKDPQARAMPLYPYISQWEGEAGIDVRNSKKMNWSKAWPCISESSLSSASSQSSSINSTSSAVPCFRKDCMRPANWSNPSPLSGRILNVYGANKHLWADKEGKPCTRPPRRNGLPPRSQIAF